MWDSWDNFFAQFFFCIVNDKRRGTSEGPPRYVWNDILNFAIVHLGCLFSSVSFEAFSHRKDLSANWRVHLLEVFGANCSKQTHWNHWSQEVFDKSSSRDQVGSFMWPLEFCGKKVWMVSVSFSIQFSFHVFSETQYQGLGPGDFGRFPLTWWVFRFLCHIYIDEIPIGLRRVLTTTGSLRESSYWIYVGQVMGQWPQDFEDTAFPYFSGY